MPQSELDRRERVGINREAGRKAAGLLHGTLIDLDIPNPQLRTSASDIIFVPHMMLGKNSDGMTAFGHSFVRNRYRGYDSNDRDYVTQEQTHISLHELIHLEENRRNGDYSFQYNGYSFFRLFNEAIVEATAIHGMLISPENILVP